MSVADGSTGLAGLILPRSPFQDIVRDAGFPEAAGILHHTAVMNRHVLIFGLVGSRPQITRQE